MKGLLSNWVSINKNKYVGGARKEQKKRLKQVIYLVLIFFNIDIKV